MELTPEDALRLNVMLANDPLAIRIDESKLLVSALTSAGETTLQLNPRGRDDQYIKRVKELLSGHVLGSPGGYPVYLQRWTRMGQMRDESLEELLKLGEPEAVVAAVCAPGLSNELARRAWWAMEDAENARRMLARDAVTAASMGPVLAAYLAEHLPFESEPETMVETVRLILRPGLIDNATRAELWKKAQRKNAYYVGFLLACPDDLPDQSAAHPRFAQLGSFFAALAGQDNPLAKLLFRVLGPPGQTYLDTVLRVLKKPATQDVVVLVLEGLAEYFVSARAGETVDLTIEELVAEGEDWLASDPPGVSELLREDSDLRALLRAIRVLSGMSYGVVRPALRGTTAIGSLMRRKLEPVMTLVIEEIQALRP